MSVTSPDDLIILRQSAVEWVNETCAVEPDHVVARKQSEDKWREIAALGWAGVAVPENAGGLGFGPAAIGVLLETLAGTLTTTPLLSTGLIAAAALGGETDLLAGLASGETVFAFASDEGPRHDPQAITTRAERLDDGWVLFGRKRFVIDAPRAAQLLVSARVGDELDLFLVEASEVAITPLDLVDGRDVGDVALEGARARPLGIGRDGIDRLCDLARIGLAAEMLGAADHALRTTVEYLKFREQFGRPIGSFQSLQHRCAQVFVDIELARSTVAAAFAAAERDGEDLAVLAVLAKHSAGMAIHRAGTEMVQMHGGIGMTAEHPAGRTLKWSRVSEALFGSSRWCADRYAELGGF